MSGSDFWARTLELARDLERRSYYDLLGVPADATTEELRAAYYRRVGELHPDRHAREPDAERRRALVLLYARIGEANRVLANPALRGDYDAGLASGITRYDPNAPSRAPAQDDPQSLQARRFYEVGVEVERAGDTKSARLQYQLALQVEPDSAVIRAALERVAAPKAAAPAIAMPLPAPAAAPVAAAPVAAAPVPLRVAPTSAARAPASDFAREHSRIAFSQPIRVKCSTWGQFLVLHTKNISRGGIFVRTANPPEIGSEAELKFEMPDGRTLELPATVVRVVTPAQATEAQPAGMGLSFLELDETTARIVDQLVREAQADRDIQASRASAPVRKTGATHAAPRAAPVVRPLGDSELMTGPPQAPVPWVDPHAEALAEAHLHVKARRFANATAQLAPILKADPNHRAARAIQNLALAYEAQQAGRPDEARTYFEMVLVFDRQCEEAIHELRSVKGATRSGLYAAATPKFPTK